MPQISRYSDEQVEQLLAELLNVLEKHKAPTDLSLMVLGNMVTNLINTSIAPAQRRQLPTLCPRLTVLYQRRQSALRETDNRLW